MQWRILTEAQLPEKGVKGLKSSSLVGRELPFPSPHCFLPASSNTCAVSPLPAILGEGMSMGTLKQEPELRC